MIHLLSFLLDERRGCWYSHSVEAVASGPSTVPKIRADDGRAGGEAKDNERRGGGREYARAQGSLRQAPACTSRRKAASRVRASEVTATSVMVLR